MPQTGPTRLTGRAVAHELVDALVRDPERDAGIPVAQPFGHQFGRCAAQEELRNRRFSTVIRCEYDPQDTRKILNTERVAPLYRPDAT